MKKIHPVILNLLYVEKIYRFYYVFLCALWDSVLFLWNHVQVVILERRSPAGKVVYRSMSSGWNGSEEDKYRLHEQLELLQKDPTYLSSDATLPELNNEMAPVRLHRHTNTLDLRPPTTISNWNNFINVCFVSDIYYSVDECCLWLHPSNIRWPSLLKLVRWHSSSTAFNVKRQTVFINWNILLHQHTDRITCLELCWYTVSV